MLQGKNYLTFILLTLIFLVESFFVWGDTRASNSALAGKLYLSEVMFAGKDDAGDEFVELYNASDASLSLKGCALKKFTETGKEYNLSSDLGSDIPAHSFFLLAPRDSDCADGKCYSGTAAADGNYTTKNFLSENNELVLYDAMGGVIDGVGWGNVQNVSGAVFAGSFSAGESLARKLSGGQVIEAGKFFLQTVPTPQNTSDTSVPSGAGDIDTTDTSQDETENDDSTQNPTTPTEDADSSIDIAAEKEVLFNELLINPAGADGTGEFVELYNAGKVAMDLSGWVLEDEAGSIGRFTFPSGTKLAAGKYAAFYSSQTKLSLNNSGDGVRLKDAAGNLISQTPLSAAASEDISFARNDGGQWVWTTAPTPAGNNIIRAPEVKKTKDAAEDKTVVKDTEENKDTVEKEEETEPAAPVENLDYSDQVLLSEVLPDPVGRDNQVGSYEWVELYNSNDHAVDLEGWCLDDVLSKGSKMFCFPSSRPIAAKGYLVVSSQETKISFNNTEEEVNLLWPDQRLEDHTDYAQAKEGQSYDLSINGNWFWSAAPTPGKKNVESADTSKPGGGNKSSVKTANQSSADFTETEEIGADTNGRVLDASLTELDGYQPVSLTVSKTLPLKTNVLIEGIVSVPSGTFGPNIFYITEKDSGNGLQVYSYNTQTPQLVLGDEVRLAGAVSESGGERRLLLRDDLAVEKLSSNNLLKATPMKCSDADQSVGNLVQLEGRVVEVTDSQLFYLADESGKVKVYAKPQSGVEFAGLKVGMQVSVIGQVSRTSLGTRVLPRFDSDIHSTDAGSGGIMTTDNASKAVSAQAGKNESDLWMKLLLLLMAVVFLDWLRMRQLRLKLKRNGFSKDNH